MKPANGFSALEWSLVPSFHLSLLLNRLDSRLANRPNDTASNRAANQVGKPHTCVRPAADANRPIPESIMRMSRRFAVSILPEWQTSLSDWL